MKKTSILLVFILTIMSGTAYASILGEDVSSNVYKLAEDVYYSKNVFYNSQQSGVGYQTENYIEYKANPGSLGVVTYTNQLYGSRNIEEAIKYHNDRNESVIAGINADFFSLRTGVPLGVVIKEGRVICNDEASPAVGINPDGTAFFGTPDISFMLNSGGTSFPVAFLNKMRQPYSIYMQTQDFSYNTKTSGGNGTNVILQINEGDFIIGTTLSATVIDVQRTDQSIPIEPDQIVLTVDHGAGGNLVANVDSLQVGMQVSITTNVSDRRFERVMYATGGEDYLVRQGEAMTSFKMAAGAAPRTAIGMKWDGTIILYSIDGRQAGHSYGVQMATLAKRMKELGCVEALNLDGGGSTSTAVLYPGDFKTSIVNSPSDGNLRKCATYIFIINKGDWTGQLSNLHLYPNVSDVLSGATVNYSVTGTDPAYYPVSVDGEAEFSTDSGESAAYGNSVRAVGNGTVNVSAKIGEAAGNAIINVYDKITDLQVYNFHTGSIIGQRITLKPGQTLNLYALAYSGRKQLISDNTCYSWTLEGDIGTIDAQGNFTAGVRIGSGYIYVRAAGVTKSVAVSVFGEEVFSDISENWAHDIIIDMYDRGIVTGSYDDLGRRVFLPQSNITRAELAVIIARYLQIDTALYNNYAIPYEDTSKIPDWALPSVKALYAAEIMKGQQNNGRVYFEPFVNLTRAEAFTSIGRIIADDSDSGSILPFTDQKDIPDWALPYCKKMAASGIISGYADNTLLPKNNITRAEITKLISMLKVN